MTTLDGRKVRGAISRHNVMRLAVDIASVDGLEGLSLATLASGAGLSKSGVAALFGTKEQLQLATIESAREIFIDAVIAPALQIKGGRARLEALLDNWIRYSETRVFTGGCFFAAAAAELGSRPGPMRDAIAVQFEEWNDALARVIARAMGFGELSASTDAHQLAFEIRALLDGANTDSLVFGSAAPYTQAREGLRRLLG